MQNRWLFRAAIFFFAIFIVAVLAWVTDGTSNEENEDPCANPQGDISASVLADSNDDQDALINRAIIMKANCDKKSEEEK